MWVDTSPRPEATLDEAKYCIMTQRKTGSSKGSRHGNDDTGKPGSSHPRTSRVIIDQFKEPRDLTTIELITTVLYDDSDEDRGATPFIDLVAALVDAKGEQAEPFDAKWLVTDTTQIKHVLGATKTRARSLFDLLTRHATVAVTDKSSKDYKNLAKAFSAVNQVKPRVVTASPSDGVDGYDYYGHIDPQAGQSWKNGPRGLPLDNVSSEVDDLLKKLHHAHVEKLTGHEGDKVKDLEKSGISILSLGELMKQP